MNISKRELVILVCLAVVISLWMYVFLSKLLNKNINVVAIETIAAFICALFLILGIIGLKSKKDKDAKEEKAIAANESKKIEDHNKVKSLAETASYVDITGAALCCAIQVVTLLLAIKPDLFGKYIEINATIKIIDLIGVAFFGIAAAMILINRCKKQEKVGLITEDENQDQQFEQKNNSQQKTKILLAGLMVLGSAINFIGKALDSFYPGSNIHLGGNKIFNPALLLRIVGVIVFTLALCLDMRKPKQNLSETYRVQSRTTQPGIG